MSEQPRNWAELVDHNRKENNLPTNSEHEAAKGTERKQLQAKITLLEREHAQVMGQIEMLKKNKELQNQNPATPDREAGRAIDILEESLLKIKKEISDLKADSPI